ncbi:hypothetical protein ACC708_36075, partial [Rhizobium ruizarguesonis]
RSVDFDVVSVQRYGDNEPWHTESISGGIRIYAGSADVTVTPGRHRYFFTYRTNRQIRYFDAAAAARGIGEMEREVTEDAVVDLVVLCIKGDS